MELLLSNILSYLISLAAGLRTDSIIKSKEHSLREQLGKKEVLQKALASTRPLREELSIVCVNLARQRHRLGASPQEQSLLYLLTDELFQADLHNWFMAGGIEEGDVVKDRLLQQMVDALLKSGATSDQILRLKRDYFDAVERAIFSHELLAQWRHHLSLEFLRDQVVKLRKCAEEAAGVFALEKQTAALQRYCEEALKDWDIIDLSNLPEGDIHLATQKLLLRQLYMPLRLEIEKPERGEEGESSLDQLEKRRHARRKREAGHFFYTGSESFEGNKMSPIGECLRTFQRLVVLGDPGGGKTTILRWMATVFLLRFMGDDAFAEIPDTEALPTQSWIPVLIRCRDLGEDDLCRCFSDFLSQHLNKTTLLPDEAGIMRTVILDRISKGEALLLIDGLDEIVNNKVRVMFCQELERTAVRYPHVPIVVTSRIVGYRDMPYRIGTSFKHGVIAELSREDKDVFAERWVEVTEQHQPSAEKEKKVKELVAALHGTDRIERLTGNPMLLTTLALVKRKVGKLPSNRNKLYAEAVSVLLNWNPSLYETIDESEAIPQLAYLAYEMCRRGVQRLTEDEVFDLLENFRGEYPHVRAVKRRSSEAFLALLEARSSILVKSGSIWPKDHRQEKSVWEFRHLTFQEYLAASALLDGRYPGREKGKSLAEHIAPLAGSGKALRQGKMDADGMTYVSAEKVELPEHWCETLRLVVAACKDDDVDEVLLAILKPLPSEHRLNARLRAVLASFCLADEPNVSEDVAEEVVRELVRFYSNEASPLGPTTLLDEAAFQVKGSLWSSALKKEIINSFRSLPGRIGETVGLLWGSLETRQAFESGLDTVTFYQSLLSGLQSHESKEAIAAALTVTVSAINGRVMVTPGLIDALMAMFDGDAAERNAGARAMACLSQYCGWQPTMLQFNHLVKHVEKGTVSEDAKLYLLQVLRNITEEKGDVTTSALLENLNSLDASVRSAVATALGTLGDITAVEPLLANLQDLDMHVREAAIKALGKLGDRQAVLPLLSKLHDSECQVRQAAIETLGELGDKQAVVPVLAMLNASEDGVRRAAIHALGQLGDREAVSPLLAKVDNDDINDSLAVIEALGNLGDKQAVGLLLEKLEDVIFDVRKAAIEALGRIQDERAIVPLIANLRNSNAELRRLIVRALGDIGHFNAVATILAMSDDPDANVRMEVFQAVEKIGDKRAVPLLLAKLHVQNIIVCRDVIGAIGHLGDREAVPPLLCKLDHPNEVIRCAAIEAIGKLGDRIAIGALRAKLEDNSDNVRKATVRAMAALGEM